MKVVSEKSRIQVESWMVGKVCRDPRRETETPANLRAQLNGIRRQCRKAVIPSHDL